MQSHKKLFWTEHAKLKMKQYGLSKSKLIQLLYRPERKEHGIVPGTTALMQKNKSYSKAKSAGWQKKNTGEIWLMYKDVNYSSHSTGSGQEMRKIISAWRYPGITKPGENIPIPEDIRQELLNNKNFE